MIVFSKEVRLIPAIMIGAMVSACGTTSEFKSTPGQDSFIDLGSYHRLLVEDFTDEASQRVPAEQLPLVQPKIDRALTLFPDQVASVVRSDGGFANVERTGAPAAGTLVMSGVITQYDEGSATKRLLIGFNAGNVNFDATLKLFDGGSGKELGTWIVDKNSWALGGVIAANQTPDEFMTAAAKAIGDELSKSRREGRISKQKKK